MTPRLTINTSEGKYVYFASDFHLGSPNKEESRKRERKIINWLDSITPTAEAIFLIGDLFDFWFEYKHVIPKGYIRLLGKIASIRDKGIPIYFFTGNHDMWMFDYFTEELNIPVFQNPIEVKVNNQLIQVGHGDGLGPGDLTYKFIKKIFTNKFCQRLFAFLHPYIGFSIAQRWSKKSRAQNATFDEQFLGEKEFLIQYCKSEEETQHRDVYIFGHRHLPLEIEINSNSKYINTGEWFSQCTYAKYDGEIIQLLHF